MDGERGVFGRRPDAQKGKRHDQRHERRQHVGERIIEIVRRDELCKREARAGDQQQRPYCTHRAQPAVQAIT